MRLSGLITSQNPNHLGTYVALSVAMREVLPFMNLMKETGSFLPVQSSTPEIKCTTWEDNHSCIKVAESLRFTPRMKHIALKYHHFRQFMSNKTIIIKPIDAKEQLADILTKPINEKQFAYLRKKIIGW